MSEPPKKDEDERFMPGDDSSEVVQTPFDRLLSQTLELTTLLERRSLLVLREPFLQSLTCRMGIKEQRGLVTLRTSLGCTGPIEEARISLERIAVVVAGSIQAITQT
jgi:hypothetical protein